MKPEDVATMDAKARAALDSLPEEARARRWVSRRTDGGEHQVDVRLESGEDLPIVVAHVDDIPKPVMEHIAASDPHAVLALIADVRQAQSDVSECMSERIEDAKVHQLLDDARNRAVQAEIHCMLEEREAHEGLLAQLRALLRQPVDMRQELESIVLRAGQELEQREQKWHEQMHVVREVFDYDSAKSLRADVSTLQAKVSYGDGSQDALKRLCSVAQRGFARKPAAPKLSETTHPSTWRRRTQDLAATLADVRKECEALKDQRFLWLGRILFPQLLDVPDDFILGRAPVPTPEAALAQLADFRKRVEEAPELIFQEVMRRERVPSNDAGKDLIQKAMGEQPSAPGFVECAEGQHHWDTDDGQLPSWSDARHEAHCERCPAVARRPR